MSDLFYNSGPGNRQTESDPIRRTQAHMRQALPRRFYKDVTIAEIDEGFVIQLDGKPVRTPGKALLTLPSYNAAALVVAEFSAQQEVIDPVSMPVLRIVNSAIDGVAPDMQAVLEDIKRYSGSDLVCYRAEGPQELVERQAAAWDPVLDWARSVLGAEFLLAKGVMPVVQPQTSLDAVGAWLEQRQDPFLLAALHVMTTLSGSALLTLAVDGGALTSDQAWAAAHIDEDWNGEKWGEDTEALARRHTRYRDFTAAVALRCALNDGR